MTTNNITSILASFTTLKVLNESGQYKSSYQLLGEFITYIVSMKSLRLFSAAEIKTLLKEIFGFDIPEAVVKSAIKKLPFIEKKMAFFMLLNQN